MLIKGWLVDIYGHKQPNGQSNLPKDHRGREQPNGAPSIVRFIAHFPHDSSIERLTSSQTTANDSDHRRMRRLLSHAFSEKALGAQEPLITRYVDLLMLRLKQQASDPATSVVDIVKWYK